MFYEHSPPDVKFEIGHVLFIDLAGYSKLLINEQSEQIQTLKEIVRGTEQVRLAEADPLHSYFATKARTLRTSSLCSGSNADSGTAVTAIVSPTALNTSIE